MPILLTCACGQSLRIKDELAGRKIRCPACGTIKAVPEVEAEPTEEDEGLDERFTEDSPPPKRVAQRSSAPVAERERRREKPRRKPREKAQQGSFSSINASVVGGLAMMLAAVVWLVAGLMVGILFYYPPVLFVIGVIALVKGVLGGH